MKRIIVIAFLLSGALVFLSCGRENESTDAAPAVITEVKASSTLAHKDDMYSGLHLVDRQPTTSWVEGKEGDGIGESVTLVLSKTARIQTVTFANGYWQEEYWGMNNRVKELVILSDKGDSFSYTLKDNMQAQTVTLDPAWEVGELRFVIMSVYPGTKWKDTSITEITITGIENSPHLTVTPGYEKAGTNITNGESADSDTAPKKEPAAAVPDIFPLTLYVDGFSFTLFENGSVTAEGSGMAQCDMEFIQGSWKYTPEHKKIITYVVNQQQDCFDYEGENDKPDWKKVELQTLIE